MAVRRALISAWDKSGVVELAKALVACGATIISTGGTARALSDEAVPVIAVESVTGYPAILDGRVKTLHPAIFAGILSRDDPAHRAALEGLGIAPIDLVVVTLYPFETQGVSAPMSEAVELIDIGGCALIRAAAKNWARVAVLSDPAQYGPVIEELRQDGGLCAETRRRLAAEAFARTAAYDAAIASYFQAATGARFPDLLTLAYRKVQQTRYGENPHQRGAFYRPAVGSGGLADARQLQGKELSFNNWVDLDAAWGLVNEFAQPAAAIIKHATPCGAATAATLAEAYRAALDCDRVSAFGGVVALNRVVDEQTAVAIGGVFTEAVIAPGFTAEARQALKKKTTLRLLEAPPASWNGLEMRSVSGGLLVQERDAVVVDDGALRVVTPRRPTAAEMADLRFAWAVAKWVKSNAIVLARDGATVGIGAGQPNRVGAVEIAVKVAGERARGAVLASDAFFPFRDGVDAAARAGVTAVMQPGGSVRDEEVIAAATEHGMAMVFTGIRHFRH
ncbi:MAG TPA: bifunctional phosphoribosylaminoimidazolecarboxamide formyltransferase/IMP cyclohydrolase [bacterium]|nr:bifunctional phosphoribosylaminoimidazolecarboxamide formyltransferase/IMP cyclohydrolase [bacterium]